ncbi:MAG: HAD family phosphatase [Kordiimonadaceae bacterium]|nr:HAD family phosphatase [Kordiimonadaceae bacterium]MBO6964792.1 HAD family phosphatase [Kordiimonadaceae bacterium]
MAIKAILFDMDGVLIDAKDWHYEALNRALELFGMPINRDAHLTTYDGLPTRKKLKMLSEAHGLPLALHEFLNDLKQQYTIEMTASLCKPLFQHQYALSKLHQRGYSMGVCSNSVSASVRTMMKLSKLEDYLKVQISNEDVTASKPDPEMYLLAMERLKVTPRETLILEDNDHGIQAVRASGAHLMVIGSVYDVEYNRISDKIAELETEELER